jgi:multiple sugar transport system substrate-binding protein
MALYYNKDLFNNAGIAEPPAFWDNTFQQYVKKLTKQDTKGQIIQAGVGMGGSTNIERSADILAMLMMQNGAVMIDDSGQVTFNSVPPGYATQNYVPGLEALRFYTDFANPAKEVYSWNKDLDNSLNMFTQNKLAMMFAYSYDLPIIKAAAPKLNFAVAPLPQIENSAQPVNFANYWVETVSKKSLHKNEAWDFVQFMTQADQAKLYLAKANRPPALRSLITKPDFYNTDPQGGGLYLDVFTNQVLTAKTWYHGDDADVADGIMNDMIDSVVSGAGDVESAINLAANKVQQTINAGDN